MLEVIEQRPMNNEYVKSLHFTSAKSGNSIITTVCPLKSS